MGSIQAKNHGRCLPSAFKSPSPPFRVEPHISPLLSSPRKKVTDAPPAEGENQHPGPGPDSGNGGKIEDDDDGDRVVRVFCDTEGNVTYKARCFVGCSLLPTKVLFSFPPRVLGLAVPAHARARVS